MTTIEQLELLRTELIVCEQEYQKAIADGRCLDDVKAIYLKIKKLNSIISLAMQGTLS